jgi:hypothetical protein
LLQFGPSFVDVPGGASTWSFAGNQNYLPVVEKSVTIQIIPRAISITADALAKNYGEQDPVFTYKITKGNLVKEDTLTGAIQREAGEDAGLHMLKKGTLSGGGNYSVNFISSWFKITQRPIRVLADPQSKPMGQPDPPLTFRIISGELVGGDMFSGILVRLPGEDPGSYLIGQGTLFLSANYNLSFTGSSLEIYQSVIDADDDQDGVINSDDNCVNKSNPDQADADGDGFGDVCDKFSGQSGTDQIVPVTGTSTLQQLNCYGSTSLKTQGGMYVTLPKDFCKLKAILVDESVESLPAILPDKGQLISALNLTLFDGSKPQSLVKNPQGIQYSMLIPAGIEEDRLKIYFWDSTQKTGTGGWIELSGCMQNTPKLILQNGQTDQRKILNCVFRKNPHRLEFSTNFPGLLVLVAE